MTKENDQALAKEINKLKKKLNAVILAHYYQPAEIQEIADILGDSLALSRKAAETEADVIVFCGVNFMAETAAIIAPEKQVLIPNNNAGCYLADTITLKQLQNLKQEHPEAVVVCYVNTTAAIKAESDICCTSSNSVKVVNSVAPEKEIIFIPDKNLCNYAAKKTKRKLICFEGYCNVHSDIKTSDIEAVKSKHPEAKVMAHPECSPDVLEMSDYVGSTAGMLVYPEDAKVDEFIVATEVGLLCELKNKYPDKVFYKIDKAVCPTMKLVSLESLKDCLINRKHEVKVDEEIASRARKAIERMLNIN
jgi:quinolinate synthase